MGGGDVKRRGESEKREGKRIVGPEDRREGLTRQLSQ